MMRHEHHATGALLERMEASTACFTAPADACMSFQIFYDDLARLVTDTHVHIHRENDVLFPAVLERQRALARRAGPTTPRLRAGWWRLR